MPVQKVRVRLKINGQDKELEIPSNLTLLELLRDELGLTGTKEGCGIGECGACTVLLNGRPVYACLVLAPKIDGREIITIEGIGQEGKLHPLQEAFLNHGAVQCGFCTPGMIMAAKALLDENPQPSKEEIEEAISGNLCRCTGYLQVVKAIKASGSGKKGEV
ncbi:MAG: (2Fe-2S)-binding protein [Deltaproteobacteria bacterium]|nr:(2Fe-2S)-binding protein [Deltaproteobacteria bacterium]